MKNEPILGRSRAGPTVSATAHHRRPALQHTGFMARSPAGPGPKAQTGFTLAELLIAITIMGLMLTALLASLNLSARIWDSGQERMDESGDILRVQGFLRDRIALARPVPVPPVTLTSSVAPSLFVGEAARMLFVAPMPAHRGGGGLHLIQLRLQEGKLLLSHRIFQGDEEDPFAGEWQDTVLLEGLEKLSFSYFGDVNENEEAQWHAEWKPVSWLPQVVGVAISWTDAQRSPWPLFRAELPVRQRFEPRLREVENLRLFGVGGGG